MRKNRIVVGMAIGVMLSVVLVVKAQTKLNSAIPVMANTEIKQGTVEGNEVNMGVEEEASETSGGSMSSENLSDIESTENKGEGDEEEYKDPLLDIEEEEAETESATTPTAESIVIIEELDLQLYAQQTCNARDKDTTNSNKVTTVEKSALLHVTGRTQNDWYRVEHAASPTNIVYIKASLLGANKPQQPQQSQPSNEDTSTSGKTETPSKPNQGTGNNTDSSSNANKELQDIISNLTGSGATGGGEGGEGAGKW